MPIGTLWRWLLFVIVRLIIGWIVGAASNDDRILLWVGLLGISIGIVGMIAVSPGVGDDDDDDDDDDKDIDLVNNDFDTAAKERDDRRTNILLFAILDSIDLVVVW